MATRTWVSDIAGNASVAGNWDTGAPGTGDTIVFNGTHVGDCNWNVTTNINSLATAGYTGTIQCTAAFNCTSGTTPVFTHGNGTFNSNGQAVALTRLDASAAGTMAITMGASTWTMGGHFNASGANLTLTYNTSTVVLSSTASTITMGTSSVNKTVYNLSVPSTGNQTVTLGSDVYVAGTFTPSGTSSNPIYNGNNFYLSGNYTQLAGGVSGTTVMNFVTATSQTITHGATATTNPAIINAAGTVVLGTTVRFGGNFTHTAGTVTNTGSTFYSTGGTITISSSGAGMHFNNLSFGGSVTIANNLYVDGILDLNVSGGSQSVTGTYTIYVSGNLTRLYAANVTGANTTIELNGADSTYSIGTANSFTLKLVINKNAGAKVTVTATSLFPTFTTITRGYISCASTYTPVFNGVVASSGSWNLGLAPTFPTVAQVTAPVTFGWDASQTGTLASLAISAQQSDNYAPATYTTNITLSCTVASADRVIATINGKSIDLINTAGNNWAVTKFCGFFGTVTGATIYFAAIANAGSLGQATAASTITIPALSAKTATLLSEVTASLATAGYTATVTLLTEKQVGSNIVSLVQISVATYSVTTLDGIRTTVTASYSGWSGSVTPVESAAPSDASNSIIIYKMSHS